MAYAGDLKSLAGNSVRVRVPQGLPFTALVGGASRHIVTLPLLKRSSRGWRTASRPLMRLADVSFVARTCRDTYARSVLESRGTPRRERNEHDRCRLEDRK